MPGKTKMLIQFGIQGCLNRDLAQHLPEFIEIFLGLDPFGRRIGYRLEFFPVHDLSVLAHDRA